MQDTVTIYSVKVAGRSPFLVKFQHDAEKHKKFHESEGRRCSVKPLVCEAYDEGDLFYTGPLSGKFQRGVRVN